MEWVEQSRSSPDSRAWKLMHLSSEVRIVVTHNRFDGYGFGRPRKHFKTLADVKKAAIKNMVTKLKKDLKSLTL